MPMDLNDPQTLEQVRQAAAARGLSVDAFLRMIQNQAPGLGDAPVMPQQRPFAEGPGPGGEYGGGQGQNDQPWKEYFPGGSWSEGFSKPGIGNQVSPAGGPQDPNAPVNINAGGPLDPNAGGGYESQPDPEADTSIFGQIRNALSYGGISFADRLGNAGTVLSAFADPHGRSLTPAIAKANENMSELRDMAERKQLYYAEQKKKQQMAQRLYNNLKDTNPEAAEALLYDYSLVDDYMKGQFELQNTRTKEGYQKDRELAVESLKQKGAMELEEYKTENDPARIKLEQEKSMWNDFLEANPELQDASTLETYQTFYSDTEMTENEAKRIAAAHMNKGAEGRDEMYTKIVEKRETAKPIAQQALAIAGVELQKGQKIDNAQEVVDSGGKIAPKLSWTEGTAEHEAQKRARTFDIKTNSADYLATQRAIDRLDLQIGGEAWTGAGYTGLLDFVPESNALELGRALQSINSGNAFQKLQDIRAANTSGAGVGNVTEGEYPIMAAAEEERFDIKQEPNILRERLAMRQNVAIAYMAMAPDGSKRSMLQYLVDGLRADPTPENAAEFDKNFGSGYSKLVLSTQGEFAR